LGDPEQRDSGARAGPEVDAGVSARLAEERDDVAAEALLDEDASRGLDEAEHVGSARDRLQRVERRRTGLLVEHPRLFRERWVAERQAHGEPVELRLRQRVRPLVLD